MGSTTADRKTETRVTLRGNRLLIRRDTAESVTEAGIVIPTAALENLKTGVVVQHGTGYRTDTQEWDTLEDPFPIGTRVQWEDFKGIPIEVNGVEHLAVKPEDILLTLHEEPHDGPDS